MSIQLQRNIYFHSPETGLISKTVFKKVNWNVLPVLGASVDDAAWHRDDITKIESINIPEDGHAYYVDLNPLKTATPEGVEKHVGIAKLNGWEFLY